MGHVSSISTQEGSNCRRAGRYRAHHRLLSIGDCPHFSRGTEWKYLLHIDKRRGRIHLQLWCIVRLQLLYGLRAAGGPENQGAAILLLLGEGRRADAPSREQFPIANEAVRFPISLMASERAQI